MTPPALALALEELLLHPQLADIADEVRAHSPVWLADQIEAAATHVSQGMRTLGADEVPTTGVPGWVRLGALDALANFLTGKATTCLHAPDALRPQPIVAAAWKPGLITCRRCAHLVQLPRNSTADRTCDGCGRVCAGTEAGDPIHPAAVQIGALLYAFGVCPACRADQVEFTS